MSKDLVFNSNFDLAKPHQVIIRMIEIAVREDRVGIDVESSMFWAKHDSTRDLGKEIDDYIERLVQERLAKD